MNGVRLILKDHQWDRMAPRLPGKRSDPGRTGADNRLFVEAVLWSARTGSPWRDLPGFFGNWNSAFVRFSRWSKAGVWDQLFATMAAAPDFEYIMIDSTIVRAHQRAAGKGGLKLVRSALARRAVQQKRSSSVNVRGTLLRLRKQPGSKRPAQAASASRKSAIRSNLATS